MSTKHILLWLPMIAIAFANAALRETILVRHFNELRAHQLSTITLMILCASYIGIIFQYLDVSNITEAFLLGCVWVLLTVVFEFSLGFLLRHSLTSMLQQYNILAGRIWLLFLLCLFLLPAIFYTLRK